MSKKDIETTETAQQGNSDFSQARPSTDVKAWIQIVLAIVLTVISDAGLYFGNKSLNPWQWVTNEQKGIREKQYVRYQVTAEGDYILDEAGNKLQATGAAEEHTTFPHPVFKYISDLVNERGPVQHLEVLAFWAVVVFLIFKSRAVSRQVKQSAAHLGDIGDVNMENDEEMMQFRRRMDDDGSAHRSILYSRLSRAMGLWLATKDQGRVSSWVATESGRDNGIADMSYTLSRTMMWAIPIFGFIGTVQGLSSAVGGFADFLQGAAELSAIKGAIADVTIGLGVAFDTTFLALILVAIVQFPLASIMRKEASLFGDIDAFLDESFIARLPSAEQQAVVIENLEDTIEAAFRRYIPDPDRYEEVFTESIEKAGNVVRDQFTEFTKTYVDARKEATDREVQELARAMENAHVKAAELAKDYAHSADGVREALQTSLDKASDAAKSVGDQMASLSTLGDKIRELLQVENALERAMAGVAASQDFQTTLAQIREHLTATDEFCKKLSKPRVITFHEEIT